MSIQKLMDEVYAYQDTHNLSRNEVLKWARENLSEKHVHAVRLGNLNYQVENGGFYQWYMNGYSDDLDDLLHFLGEFKEESVVAKVFQLLYSVKDAIEEYKDAFRVVKSSFYLSSQEESFREFLEDRLASKLDIVDSEYHEINDKFLQVLETLYFSEEDEKEKEEGEKERGEEKEEIKMLELPEISEVKDIKQDHYYLYPSRDTSVGLVIRGSLLLAWIDGEVSDFYLGVESIRDVTTTLAQVYKPDFLRQRRIDWDKNVPEDELVTLAYLITGKDLVRIKYGSSLYKLLSEKVIKDE